MLLTKVNETVNHVNMRAPKIGGRVDYSGNGPFDEERGVGWSLDDGAPIEPKIARMREAIGTGVREAVKALEVEKDPRLSKFADHYGHLEAADQARCPWPEVQVRLLARGGFYLNLADRMDEGGMLFEIDQLGNPRITDGGDAPSSRGIPRVITVKKFKASQ